MVDISTVSSCFDLGIEIVKLSGLQKQALRLKGKTVFVTGLGGSGKTTFINYLQHGFFDEESRHIVTQEASSTKPFSISIGDRSSLQLDVKRAIEIPGQLYPRQHAQLAKKYNPKCILLLADLCRSDLSIKWIEEFCRSLEHEWLGNRDNELKSLNIVLNKADKMEMDEGQYASYEADILSIVQILGFSLGALPKVKIQVYPCSLVSNSNGTTLVDRVIRKMALDLEA